MPEEILTAWRRAELVVDAGTVTRAIDRTGVRISVALGQVNPLVLCVMNGALVYGGRLLGRLHFPLELACVHVARYGDFTEGGKLAWLSRPQQNLDGRDVLIVDDVLDDGDTLRIVRQWALEEGANRVWTTVLVRKRTSRNESVHIDFTALECPDRYLIGCGMDYRSYWRNLPAIYALPEDLERAR